MMINGQDRTPSDLCGSHFNHSSLLSPTHHLQEESCLSEVKSDGPDSSSSSHQLPISEIRRCNDNIKPTKLKIVFSKTKTHLKFIPGTVVEVRINEDGYNSAWYTATIVGSDYVGKFVVEYKSLMNEDKTMLLKQVVDEKDIRPYPPNVSQSCRYEVLQGVDAWYNGGWWEGVISEVFDDMKYFVYIASLNEKLVYDHSNLRPRQNWVDAKWVLASQACRLESYSAQKRPSTLKLRPPSPKRKLARTKSNTTFTKGTMVEVRSDEPGYEGSWYTAKIIKSKQNGKFIVEYLTLKTDDLRRRLREEANGEDIRPLPPKTEDEKRYQLLEKVDAWYNEGWWAGVVSKQLSCGRYVVYFGMTGEEMEFDPRLLRVHREWVAGKWIDAD